MKTFWIKNTCGKSSASLTMIMVAFTVVMVHMTLGMFVNPFGLAITPFNAAEAMMVLSPLLMLYFGRRNTDAKEQENILKHGQKKPISESSDD